MLLGGSVNALWVARSMARAGVPVHALADGISPSLVRHSHAVAGFVDVSSAASAQDEWLAWLPSGPPGAVVLPCGDAGVEFIATHRWLLLSLGYRPVEADDEVALALLDKARTSALAEAVGIDAPRTFVLRAADDLDDVAAKFDFPCALKPLHSHRDTHRVGAKALVVHDAGELRRESLRLQSMDVASLVTEIIPGPESGYCSYYTYLAADGSPLLHFTKRKPRQYPIGFGWGCFHETGWEPEAREIGLHFLQGVGVRGLAFVEFKRDARDGHLKLIECNPRLSAANELVRLAGVDLAMLAYERAMGNGGPRFGPWRSGLREWYPLADTRACIALSRAGELSLGTWARSLTPPLHLPIFDRRDLQPSLVNALRRSRRLVDAVRIRTRPGQPG